jgi:hypothetical protein
MRMSVKKRLAMGAASVTAVGAVATLVAGFTFGLFSGCQGGGANTFTAGTVSIGTPTSVTCTVSGMVPGDSSSGASSGSKADAPCTFNVTYTGSASAWLAVDVSVSSGGTALYDTTASGLQLFLKDGSSTSYVSGASYKQQGGASASLPVGSTQNLLVSTSAASNGAAVNFSLDYALPAAAGNQYQNGSTTVTLTIHAVQSGNNALPSGCAAGQQCSAGSGFSWS